MKHGKFSSLYLISGQRGQEDGNLENINSIKLVCCRLIAPLNFKELVLNMIVHSTPFFE